MLRRFTLSVALAVAALVSLSSMTLAYSAPVRVAPGSGSCQIDAGSTLNRVPICTTAR